MRGARGGHCCIVRAVSSILIFLILRQCREVCRGSRHRADLRDMVDIETVHKFGEQDYQLDPEDTRQKVLGQG